MTEVEELKTKIAELEERLAKFERIYNPFECQFCGIFEESHEDMNYHIRTVHKTN